MDDTWPSLAVQHRVRHRRRHRPDSVVLYSVVTLLPELHRLCEHALRWGGDRRVPAVEGNPHRLPGELHRLGRRDGDGGCGEALASLPTTYQFRYTTLLSDGDAKTHTHLCGLEMYGGDMGILKEECVNHVAKRLGTALRKLSTQSRKRGVTLGGRGFGKLTAATVVKLTGYYGKAIRSHAQDLQGMSDRAGVNSVFAIQFQYQFR